MVRYATVDTYLNDAYNVNDAIMYVRDETDGDLKRADVLSNGVYTVKTDLDLKKEGTYTVNITARDKAGNESTEKFTVRVLPERDTKAPVIMVLYASTEIKVGQKYDPVSAIMYVRDERDGDLKKADTLTNGVYTVTTDLNTSKEGTYTVNIAAKDKSGNESTEKFTVKVTGTPSTSGPTTIDLSDEDPVFRDTSSLLVVANKVHRLPEGYAPSDLVNVNDIGGVGTIAPYMRSEAAQAVVSMTKAAAADGLTLMFSSAYRSEDYQRQLYNGYVNSYGTERADRISSRPGYSDHQTGLACDFVTGTSVDFTADFENTQIGKWLHDNAYKYGFIMRYPKGKDAVTGYAYEPWHFRYVGVDVATAIHNEGDTQTFEEHFGVAGGQEYK